MTDLPVPMPCLRVTLPHERKLGSGGKLSHDHDHLILRSESVKHLSEMGADLMHHKLVDSFSVQREGVQEAAGPKELELLALLTDALECRKSREETTLAVTPLV